MLAGSLSEEGLLLYLRVLQTLLPLLPVSENSSRPEIGSDSEDDDDAGMHPHSTQVIENCIVHLRANVQESKNMNGILNNHFSLGLEASYISIVTCV